jgi:hypothetical protein
MYVDAGKFARIPAVVKERADVWRQAEENAARRPLNAIGIARQLALLIMDMYDGEEFGRFEAVVLPGECDRAYYAQVANGQAWPIKRGMGQAVLTATGLKSKYQISNYRRLLGIEDEMWVQADLENWAEGRIREVVQIQNRPPETDVRLTTVNLTSPETGETGGQTGEMTGFGENAFEPFKPVGGDNLGYHPPTPSSEVGGGVAGLAETPPDGQGHGPVPTADEEYREELFVFADTATPKEREPVVVGHVYAAMFLRAIENLNAATVQDRQVAAAVASLLQLSPESVRQIVTAYGGLETYRAEIERMTQTLWNFLNPRMDELVELLETLQAVGERMKEEDGDA